MSAFPTALDVQALSAREAVEDRDAVLALAAQTLSAASGAPLVEAPRKRFLATLETSADRQWAVFAEHDASPHSTDEAGPFATFPNRLMNTIAHRHPPVAQVVWAIWTQPAVRLGRRLLHEEIQTWPAFSTGALRAFVGGLHAHGLLASSQPNAICLAGPTRDDPEAVFNMIEPLEQVPSEGFFVGGAEAALLEGHRQWRLSADLFPVGSETGDRDRLLSAAAALIDVMEARRQFAKARLLRNISLRIAALGQSEVVSAVLHRFDEAIVALSRQK